MVHEHLKGLRLDRRALRRRGWISPDELKKELAALPDVAGKIGEVSDVTEASFKVTAQGGTIEVLRARGEDGKKLSGGEFARAAGLASGTLLGN